MGTQISTLAPKNAAQAALSNGAQMAAMPVVLFGLTINNTKISAQFIQLHDSATPPADGAIPVLCISLAASASVVIDLGVYGMNFANGVYACNSSTAPTKTAGLADCQFFARMASA